MPENRRLVVYGGDETESDELPVVELGDPDVQTAIDSIVANGVDTILLADCRGAESLQGCDMALSVAEAKAGRESGQVRIIAGIASAAGVMRIATLGGKSARLAGLAWNGKTFSTDTGHAGDPDLTHHAWAQVRIAARAFDLPVYVFAGDGG